MLLKMREIGNCLLLFGTHCSIIDYGNMKGVVNMEFLLQLLAPLEDNASWSAAWAIFNIGLHIAGVAALTALMHRALHWLKEKYNKTSKNSQFPEGRQRTDSGRRPPRESTVWGNLWALLGEFYKNYFWPLLFALLVYGLLPFLYYCKQHYDTKCPFNFLLDVPYALLDTFLCISSLLNDPFSNLPSANIIARYAIVIGYGGLFILVYRMLHNCISKFVQTLEDRKKGTGKKFSGKSIVISVSVSVVSLGAITGVIDSEEPLNLISNAWKWIRDAVLELFELINNKSIPANFDELVAGLLAFMLTAFGIMLILGLFVAFLAFVAYLIDDAENIFKTISKKYNEVREGLFKGLLMMLAIFLIVLLIIYVVIHIPDIVTAIGELLSGKPDVLLIPLQNIGVFIGGLTLCILVGGFAVTFCCYLFFQAKKWLLFIKDKDVDDHQDKTINTVIITIACLIGFCLVVFQCFSHVYEWICRLCAPNTNEMAPVLGGIILAALLILGVLILLALLLGLTISAGAELWKVFFCGEKLGFTIFKGVWEKVLRLIGGIIHVVADSCFTIFSIIRGYRNESEKNAAVFVAASFASLASFANTFMGLLSFNNNHGAVTVFTSLAIAFAVQLAMLIFGMKAGQAMAEDMVINTGVFGRSTAKLVLNRIMVWLLQVTAVISCAVAVYSSIPVPSWILNAVVSILLLWFTGSLIVNIVSIIRNKVKVPSTNSLPKATRRVPAWLYFGAYILLMIVSTGFAFNNLFNAYAETTQLHSQVYNEVQAESEKQIIEELDKLVQNYIDDREALKAELKRRWDLLKSESTRLQGKQDELAQGEFKNHILKANSRDAGLKLSGLTMNLDDLYENLIRILDSDVSTYASVIIKSFDCYYLGGDGIVVSTNAIVVSETDTLTNSKTNGNDSDESSRSNAITIGIDFEARNEDDTNSWTQKFNDFVPKIENEEDNYGIAQLLTDKVYGTPIHDRLYIRKDIGVHKKTLTNVSKFQLIEELLKIFEQIEQEVHTFKYVPAQTDGNGDRNNINIGEGRSYLVRLQNAELVFDQLKKTCAENGNNPSGSEDTSNLSVLEMHRIVSNYLNSSSNPTKSNNTEKTTVTKEAEEKKYDKESALNELEAYIRKVLTINNILGCTEQLSNTGSEPNPTDATDPAATPETTGSTNPPEFSDTLAVVGGVKLTETEKPDVGAELPNPNDDEDFTDISETDESDGGTKPTDPTNPNLDSPQNSIARRKIIQAYLSYARSITNSDLLLSYDTLFRGSFGLNPTFESTDKGIEALYSSQTVAVFILLICALIDFMAFFAGLLLFQNAFLISFGKKEDNNGQPTSEDGKATELGYLALDAMLTNYFMPPDEKGHQRTYRLALIFCCLNNIQPEDIENNENLPINVNTFTLKGMLTAHKTAMRQYGLSDSDIAVWLRSFMTMNNIMLDEIMIRSIPNASAESSKPGDTHPNQGGKGRRT